MNIDKYDLTNEDVEKITNKIIERLDRTHLWNLKNEDKANKLFFSTSQKTNREVYNDFKNVLIHKNKLFYFLKACAEVEIGAESSGAQIINFWTHKTPKDLEICGYESMVLLSIKSLIKDEIRTHITYKEQKANKLIEKGISKNEK